MANHRVRKPQPHNSPYWTVQELCQYLRIGRTTLYRFRDLGWFGKPRHVGSRVLFRPDLAATERERITNAHTS